jgi:hypothetical protein
VLLLATASAQADPAADAALDALFAALAKPTPTATGFVEQRESELLDAPLLLRGTLERPADGVLVRAVESPYRERTTITAERVMIEREGRQPRRFSLRRAPELAALLSGFQALLDGDRHALDPHYTIALAAREDGWTLQLEPHDAGRRAPAGLTLVGHADQLDCIVVRPADDPPSRMLVGDAALADAPEFDRHCAMP